MNKHPDLMVPPQEKPKPVKIRNAFLELPDNAAVKQVVRGSIRYVQWEGGEDLYDAPRWVWNLVWDVERGVKPDVQ